MSKKILLISCLLFSISNLFSQNSRDTSQYPYWIEMMQDRSVNFYKTQRAFTIYWTNRSIQKGSGWKAFKRWEWLSSKIIDSLGNFPDASLQLQSQQQLIDADNLLWDIAMPGLGAGSVACKTQGDWKSIGPTTIPTNNTGQINGMGRVNAIAPHPSDSNTIYIGSAAGGIWKTSNGGITWTVNTDSLPTLGVSAIAINPTSPSIMYFGSGDRDASDAAGFGVFKSTNAGLTWTISNSGMGNIIVGRLIIDPKNTNTLLAACNGGIYRSTNAGASWTQTFSGGFFKDIIFKPNNSNVVYATNAGLLYRSVNNGVNWTNITNGLPTTSISRAVIEVSAINPSLVYFWIANGSVHKGIYLSRDSGSTFRTQSTTPNLHDYASNGSGTGGQAWYDMDMVCDPANQAILYCGGVNIFKSTDTGKTWTIAGYWVNQIHADQHELAASPLNNRIFAGNDGGFYGSRNQGSSWQALNSGLGIAQIYKLDASRTTKDILINGYQDNGTGNYRDAWYTTRGGDGMDCEIDQTDSRYSYGELYYGNIFRVLDVNMQASIAYQGYIAAGSDTISESGAWVTPITLKEGSGNTMYIGYKNIWRSNNIRTNTPQWKKVSNNLGGTNTIDFNEIESCIANPDIFYAARSNGTFYRSDNINATTPTWTTVTQPVAGVINSIETDPKNQNIVYIGVGARVYRSTNKGGSWTQIASNLSYNVGAVLLDTSNKKKGIYVGTMGGGVWYTDTVLNTWRYFSKGLPNSIRVTDIEMYYEPNKKCNCNVLYASTYNRGNFYSTIYNDGTAKPVALVETYDTIVCKSKTVNFKQKSCNSPGRFKWVFSPSTYTYVNGTDSMSETPSITFSASGTYTFKFMAENCIGTDTMSSYIIVGDTVKTTCIPTTTNNFNGLGIYNVSMAGVSRASGGRTQEGGFVDITCSKIFRVKRGKKYALSVTTGASNTEQVKAFIDFNNNGNLGDAGELVFQPAAALINHLDTISIPMNATTGTMLRMRIRSDFLSIGTNPCSTLSYGQTEDYGIYIEADNLIPKFVSDKKNVCPGFAVKFTDSSSPVGFVYSWDFGIGASPATANGKGPYTVKYNSSGYKTVRLTVDSKLYKKDSAILVYASPDMSISFSKADSSLCKNKAFSLKANDANASGATYQWRLKGINILDSTFQFYRISNAQFSDSGIYSVIASTAQCKDTAYRRVYIRPLPVSMFTINDTDQCLKGNQFIFTNSSTISSGTYKNYWTLSDAYKDSTISLTHSFANFGIQTVKLKSKSNYACLDSITKTIRVYENPLTSFTLTPATQCFRNNRITFNNSSSISAGTFSNLWTFGNGSSSTAFTPTSYSYPLYDTGYIVKLVLTSNMGCKDSLLKSIQLFAQPSASFTINDTDQCKLNNNFIFNSTGTIANGSYSLVWDFADASSSLLSNPSHAYSNPGQYKVKLTMSSNHICRDTAYRNVYVYPQPKAAFSINDSTQCLKGHVFVMTNNSFIGSGIFTSTWLFGDASQLISLNAVKMYAKDSLYSMKLLTISDKACRDSVIKPIRVYPNTSSTFTIANAIQCFKGNSFNFNNTSKIKSGSFNSLWQLGDGSSSILKQPIAKTYTTFQDSLKVTLVNTSNFNCFDTSEAMVYLLPSVYAGFYINDSEQCLKSNTFIFTNQSSTDKGPSNSKWYFGDGNNSGLANPNHTYTNEGTFIVKMLVNAAPTCTDSVIKTIVLHPDPNASFTVNDDAQCLKSNIFNLTENGSISSGTFTSKWKFGDGDSASGPSASHSYKNKGNYQMDLILNSNFKCMDTAIKNVQLFEDPIANFAIDDSLQCLNGNSFNFTDKSISSTSYSRTWYLPNKSNGTSATNSNAYSDTGKVRISLHILSSDACSDSISKDIYIAPMPVFTINGNKSVCLNDTLKLTANGMGNLSYQWKVNSVNTSNGNPLQLNTSTSGIKDIEVSASNIYNCVSTLVLPARVVVHNLPIVSFSHVSDPYNSGIQIVFTDNGNYPIISRQWTYTSGPGGNQKTDSLFLTDTSTLTATLSVTDSNLCSASESETFFFTIPNSYFIPNAFSPNGDKHNDEFKLNGFLKFKSYRMRIYGRWGELLFETNDAEMAWNGTFEGEIVPTGHYLFMIDIEDVNGNFIEKRGMLLLIR